jgi:hypothetical protein
MPYAQDTSVSVDRSIAELRRTLTRFGASAFAFAIDETAHNQQVLFRINARHVRMLLPMPAQDDPLITRTAGGKLRSQAQIDAEYDKEVRRRWRSLNLVVKAKLEAVASGISTIEREFLADMVTSRGETVGQVMEPYLVQGEGPLALER